MTKKEDHINHKKTKEDTTMKNFAILIMLLFSNMYSSAQGEYHDNYTNYNSLNDHIIEVSNIKAETNHTISFATLNNRNKKAAEKKTTK